MNRQPKTRFDFLRRSHNLKQQVKVFQDNSDFSNKFKQGQAVFALNFGKGPKWLPGIVLKALSPRNYEIQVYDTVWKRHDTQIWDRFIPQPLLPRKDDESFLFPEVPTQIQQPVHVPLPETRPEPQTATSHGEVENNAEPLENTQELHKKAPVSAEPSSIPTAEKRYPTRERRKPQRLGLNNEH